MDWSDLFIIKRVSQFLDFISVFQSAILTVPAADAQMNQAHDDYRPRCSLIKQSQHRVMLFVTGGLIIRL